MGLFKVFFTTTTLVSVIYCDEQLLSIELTLPDIMATFTSIDQALRSLQGSDITMTGTQSLAEDLMMKMQQFDGGPQKIQEYELASKRAYKDLRRQPRYFVKSNPFSYITGALLLLRRTNQMRPSVEMGPGAFKTEIVTYPPNYFVNRLKTLIKIKQKQEEMNRNLNARKENEMFLRIF